MKILVAGASGATGRWLVEHLLENGHDVKAVVRSAERLSESIRNHEKLTLIIADIWDMSDTEMADHVKDCDAVASCLGHNITFKGMFGHPRKLVSGSVARLCAAVKNNNPQKPVKFVLMNTTGNRNRDLAEPRMFTEKVVVGLLRALLPPHRDNELAADYLRVKIGQNDPHLEWTAVRPDGLIDETTVTDYDIFESPNRSPIFNPGQVSRINVAHFMAQLIVDDELWNQWKGRMPVIYSKD